MDSVQYTFERYEKKFLLTPRQRDAVLSVLKTRMEAERYGTHTICNVYYDTNSFDLIRASLERPAYKEKFRLRSYGIPEPGGTVFAEIKKKFHGVVYKRRVSAASQAVRAFVLDGQPLHNNQQIQREIQWFLKIHRPVPKVFIGYERMALEAEAHLRITFDWNIRWRMSELDLCAGDKGELVLPDNPIVMEVKTLGAIPLWLAELLSDEGLSPARFSKYGVCYQTHILPAVFRKGRRLYV